MSASNTETETETGSPDQQPECVFDADDLDIPDSVRENYNLEEWECSRPVWEEASENRCVWHASDERSPKPSSRVQETVCDGDLHGSILSGADISNVDFSEGVGFIDANISDVKFPSVLPYTNFNNANLTDIKFSRINLSHVDFSNADLADIKFSRINLSHVDFSNANLTDVKFFLGNLADANFQNAMLSGGGFQNTDLISANFQSADLTEIDLRGVNISKANLRGADFSEINADQATMIGQIVPLPYDKYNRITSAQNCAGHARAYHDLKTTLSDQGLLTRARRAQSHERRARTIEARQRFLDGVNMKIAGAMILIAGFFGLMNTDGKTGEISVGYHSRLTRRTGNIRKQFVTWIGGVLSRWLTGYGTRPTFVFAWTGLILVLTTAWFELGPVPSGLEGGPLYYSVVTFVTSPPHPIQEVGEVGMITEIIVLLETYIGTTLIVLLGYVLGNRERV